MMGEGENSMAYATATEFEREMGFVLAKKLD